MEEYLKIIQRYLPIQFADEEANEFVKYLSETYLENIEKGKHQFAFKAFHMLYMTFIYKISWSIKINPDAVQIFDYSYLTKGETEAIRGLLKNKGFHKNDIQKCENHISVRNHCSHASGKIEYDEKGVDHFINEEVKYIEKLQKKIEPELKKLLEDFLESNWQKNLISGDFQNFFQENYFSLADLELLSKLDLPLFIENSNNEKTIKQKIIYLLLIFEIQNKIESEENLFLQKLPMLMIDLSESIQVEKDGDKEEEYTNKIIEETLFPLSSQFSFEEWKKISDILEIE